MNIKNLVKLDDNKLLEMNVGKKFAHTFKRIYIYLGLSLCLLIVSIVVGITGYHKLYNNYYNQNTYQGLLRIHNQNLGKSAWWALATRVSETRQEQIVEFHETMLANMKEDLANLKSYRGETELIKSLETNIKNIEATTDKLATMYAQAEELEDGSLSNGNEIYAVMRDELRPEVMLTVENTRQMTTNVSHEVTSSYDVTIVIMAILVVISIIMTILLIIFMRNAQITLTKCVVEPVDEVAKAAEQMARGDLNVSIEYHANDEFDILARDLENSTRASLNIVSDISDSLNEISEGDFSVGTITPDLYHGNFGPISESMNTITDKLSNTMNDVKAASARVSEGAANMSKGANELAEGATDQAAAVEQLTASVSTVTEQTEKMAEDCAKGVQMSIEAQKVAKDGADKMDQVTEAMQRITSASKEIQEVANSIEAISSQTKLLALNASIEAARAGDTGKGFAVVAQEIGQLAQQSNDAVQRTHALVNSALSEIESGNEIVAETQVTLHEIGDSVNELAEMMRASGDMAQHQASNMREINQGIEQISEVIQNNSATAQESSAVSSELSEQSTQLHNLMAQFQVK
ncbi:MAG: methyl-accepting chemotaxis protein [Butyrivibrio sp.]|uniref:methyl-accepting chemotaxis protein n=1 Tax=Butyrivibrio sp. TaxID=28121 RepID=UPI001B16BE23|nr:methyl-accepting chemotaxis protein [Butyrivibrio sp.]MBO6240636.1 methyl-accepting chemotaxis protein [Butyrivibrio sp.]